MKFEIEDGMAVAGGLLSVEHIMNDDTVMTVFMISFNSVHALNGRWHIGLERAATVLFPQYSHQLKNRPMKER